MVPPTDGIFLAVLELILIALLLVAIVMELIAKYRFNKGYAHLTVVRGERSMNGLFTVYGIAAVVYSISVDVSSVINGHKTTLVFLNYAGLTYLFFFNSWFRNSVLFKGLGKIQND